MITHTYTTVLLILVLNAFIVVCTKLDNWPEVSPQIDIADRAQRDVEKYVLIDQVSGMGVSLNRHVFDKEGYTLGALSDVGTLLNVGVQTLMVDLYWNEFTQKWQLCPAPFPANATSDIMATNELHWENKSYKCEASLTVDHLMLTISLYLASTNTNFKVNFIQLLIRLKSIRIDPPRGNSSSTSTKNYISSFQPADLNFLKLNNATLNDTVNLLGTSLFTPTELSHYRSSNNRDNFGFYNDTTHAYPNLDTFLLRDYKRVTVTVIANDLVKSNHTYNITSGDKKTIFVEGNGIDTTIALLSDPRSITKCNELIHHNHESVDVYNDMSLREHFRVVIDDNGTSFSNDTFSDFVRCGYSPILNASSYNIYDDEEGVDEVEDSLKEIIDNFVPLSYWSWAKNQLIEPDKGFNISDYSNNNDDNANNDNNDETGDDDKNDEKSLEKLNSRLAYKCVVLDWDGWKIADCYGNHPFACKKSDSPNEWHVDPEKKKEYFNAYMSDNCPEDYYFGTPLLSIEMLALMNYVERKNISFPLWIDLNDITVPDCFVTGGPYATCPYQRTVTKLKLVGLIAPSFIVAVVILVLIFCEKLFRTKPIQSNRKRHWKKVINDYVKKYDYEGVPS